MYRLIWTGIDNQAIFAQYLAEIEDHLNVTIQQVGPDIKVPMNEFDGKVTYGEKRMAMGM